MKKSDIFEIAIKILGLSLFIFVVNSFLELISAIQFMFLAKEIPIIYNSQETGYTIMMIASVLKFLILTAFATFLTFGSKTVIKKICSPSDFEENTQLFIEKKTIYEIALVIIGVGIIVWTIPDFLLKLNSYIQVVQSDFVPCGTDKSFLYGAIIRIALGLIIVIYSKPLARRFSKEKTKNTPE